jgi:hypothetical protein
MPRLPDPKHEQVVQTFVKGSNQLDAYTSVGFKKNAGNASKFFSRLEVQKRVNELIELKEKKFLQEVEISADVAKRLGISKEKIIKALWLNADRCMRGDPILDDKGEPTGRYTGGTNPSAANQALKLIGMECHGMFIERMEIGNPGDFARLTDDELFARVEADAAALGLDSDATEALMLTFQSGESDSEE